MYNITNEIITELLLTLQRRTAGTGWRQTAGGGATRSRQLHLRAATSNSSPCLRRPLFVAT